MSTTTRTYAKIVPSRRALAIALIAFLIIAVTAGYIWIMTDQVIAPPMDPLSMVDAFHYAVNSEDVDAVLALFADDAFVTDNGLVILGRDEIRMWLMHSQRMAGTRLIMLKSELVGEKVIWFDESYKQQETYYHGSYLLKWEAIIQDGKIQSLAAIPRYWPDLK